MQHPAHQLLLVAVYCFMLHKHEVAPYTHGAASTVNTRANPELGPVTYNGTQALLSAVLKTRLVVSRVFCCTMISFCHHVA